MLLTGCELIAWNNVVGAAFNNTYRGYKRELRFILQFLDVERAAVAHCGAYLAEGNSDVVMQRACIRYVGIDTFLEGELGSSAKVITLPVAGTVGAFTPVFLIECAVELNLICRAFIEAREVTSEHHKVCAHGKRKSDMVIVNDTAVRADRNVDACLLIVFVTCLADIDKSRSLTASDTLRLTGDADGAAADTDLDEICSCLCEEQEAFTINNIACANLYLRSELLMNVVKSNALPLGISF